MNDLVEGCRITGKVLLDGENIYGDIDINLLRKRVGMVFQKPNPFNIISVQASQKSVVSENNNHSY